MPYPALLGLTVDTRSHSLRASHPAVTCWVFVALRVQYLEFLGDDGCYGLLVTGLWVPGPGNSTLSAIRRNLWYDLGFLSVDDVCTSVVRRLPSLCAWLHWNFFVRQVPEEQFIQGLRCQLIAHCTRDFARSSPIWCRQLGCH